MEEVLTIVCGRRGMLAFRDGESEERLAQLRFGTLQRRTRMYVFEPDRIAVSVVKRAVFAA